MVSTFVWWGFMLGTYWFLALSIVVSVALAAGGLLLVRRFVSHETLLSHHDVAGHLLAIIGTLYAVVLGLIVVNALNSFQSARSNVEREANSLHDIFHLARGLPAPYGVQLRKACLDYAHTMVDDEWVKMQTGHRSLKAHKLMAQLWGLPVAFQPESQAEADLQQAVLTQLDSLSDCRHTRFLLSQSECDAPLWVVLISGGSMLVIFTYFFGVERLSIQLGMTVMVTLALALNLTMVQMFGYPHSGDVRVSCRPFAYDVDIFESELNGKPLSWSDFDIPAQ